MNQIELANLLDGNIMGQEISKELEAVAKEQGLVVVFGASDDLVEFRGAISDEGSEGNPIQLSRSGLFDWETECDCQCQYMKAYSANLPTVTGFYGSKDHPQTYWHIATKLPHSVFNITEEGEEGASIGIVFDFNELPHLPVI